MERRIKLKKTTVCKSYEEGGLNMVDIHSFLTSLKVSWLRRLMDSNSANLVWSNLYPSLHNLQKFGSDYIQHCSSKIKNPFWVDVLKHYKKLFQLQISRGQALDTLEVHQEPIFYNTHIKRNKKCIFMKEWETNGILKIKDLLDNNDEFVDYNGFKEKYNAPQTNFMLYYVD